MNIGKPYFNLHLTNISYTVSNGFVFFVSQLNAELFLKIPHIYRIWLNTAVLVWSLLLQSFDFTLLLAE